jgi:hypothetical protein
MIYKIVEIATAKQARETYVLVHFWEKAADVGRKPPVLINDFIMSLRPTIATEAGEVECDVPGALRENILAYWERAQKHGWRGDHSSAVGRATQAFTEKGRVLRPVGTMIVAPIERDQSDPQGILKRPDVQALRDQTFEERASSPL